MYSNHVTTFDIAKKLIVTHAPPLPPENVSIFGIDRSIFGINRIAEHRKKTQNGNLYVSVRNPRVTI